jgi:DNA-directed RNA polymerase subunit L/DNA-directed RNA polymerase alpha subunit
MAHFSSLVASAASATFDVADVDVSVVNAIRRTILADVETAVLYYDASKPEASSVRMIQNTGSLHNEFLGHRLTLIPLCFDENELHKIKDGDATYRFQLKVHNTGSDILPVRTNQFVVYDPDGNILTDEDRNKLLPADAFTKDHILITRLKPNTSDVTQGEALHVEGVPKIGRGSQNACWSPVSQCTFCNKIDDAAAQVAFERWLAGVQERRGSKALSEQEQQEYRRRFFITDAQRHFFVDDRGEPRMFTFSIESVCGLRPTFLVFDALRLLHAKLAALARRLVPTDAAADVEDAKAVTVVKSAAVDGLWEVTVANEGHTLGNLLQSMLYNEHLYAYVGYHQGHPLEESVTFKLQPKDAAIDELAFRRGLSQAIRTVADRILALTREWIEFAKLPRTLSAVQAWDAASKNF